ncbi:hypothetical protein [Thioalkalivibrio sp. ARh3]|uniref:hypothetical protein n=1 Tax=Thioalkalivibrio sp. ARh3 TaxID=1158148 RepID=UPI00038200B5|nr:hypothetical protein [Thioalkalivibrio sp. ARh3]
MATAPAGPRHDGQKNVGVLFSPVRYQPVYYVQRIRNYRAVIRPAFVGDEVAVDGAAPSIFSRLLSD